MEATIYKHRITTLEKYTVAHNHRVVNSSSFNFNTIFLSIDLLVHNTLYMLLSDWIKHMLLYIQIEKDWIQVLTA